MLIAELTESAPIQHTNYWTSRVRQSRSTALGGTGTFRALIRSIVIWLVLISFVFRLVVILPFIKQLFVCDYEYYCY